jgi:hypothetical protein
VNALANLFVVSVTLAHDGHKCKDVVPFLKTA